MNYESACRAIKEHFESRWGEIIPIIYPNEIEDIGNPPYFGRMTIRPGSGRQVAVGGRQHRRIGVVIVQLFVEQDTGQDAIGALEEQAVRIFIDHVVPGIHFFDVGADRIGLDGRGYFQSNVNASFQFDAA